MEPRCVVLDLDETFVHTISETKKDWELAKSLATEETNKRLYTIEDENKFMWGVIRPYHTEFLDACYSNFDIVGVWSAGTKLYVDDIVEYIFKSNGYEPHFIWSRTDCDNIYDKDYEDTRILYKPLNKLYYNFEELNKYNTIIVDDNTEVCSKNSLNHILISKWKPKITEINKEDNVLLFYAEWMNSLDYDDYDSMKDIPLPKISSKNIKN